MNKSRKISLLNMFINLAVIIMSVIGLYYLIKNPIYPFEKVGPDMLKYYEVLTSLVTFLAAGLMIWANIVSFIKKKDCTPRLFYSMRYLSAVMSLLTFITVVAFIYPAAQSNPQITDPLIVIFGMAGGSLFLHFLCPIISMIQFTCFEIEPKARFLKTVEPLIGTVLYFVGIIASVFAIQQTQGPAVAANFAPYFFFWVTPELAAEGAKTVAFGSNYLVNIGILVGVILIAYAAAILLWLFNRMFHAAFIGEEYQPITPTKTKKAPSKKKGAPAPKKGNAFTSFVKRKVAFGDGNTSSGPVYHISYHDRRLKTWKVKAENASRALKVFPTQKEAIAFANSCVRKSGGSIRVHSMMGRMRKE